jgi:glutathione S-transferase
MSLVLYGFPVSQPCRAVDWFIAKNKIPGVQQVTKNIMKGELYAPDYAAINPHQTIPALRIDDKETLTEGAAIMLYLSNKNGRKDQPEADSFEHIRMMEALIFHDGMGRLVTKKFFRPIVLPKFANLTGASLSKAKKDAAEGVEELNWTLKILDERLAKNGGFCAGATFTLADYLLAAELTQLEILKVAWPEGFSMDGYENITKFLEHIKGIEGYAAFVAPLAMVKGAMDAPWAE